MPAWIKKSFHGFEQRSLSYASPLGRFARDALTGPERGLSRLEVEPNANVRLGHPHREIFVVVGGSGRARLDQDLVELNVWDVLRVGDGVPRAFEAGPDGLHMLCLGGGAA